MLQVPSSLSRRILYRKDGGLATFFGNNWNQNEKIAVKVLTMSGIGNGCIS
jgi:hypothetical protein